MRHLKKFLTLFIAFTLFTGLPGVVFAQSNFSLKGFVNDDIYKSRISEYFFNQSGKEILRPVRIIGNIQKPGLYHLPLNTSLTTLMAISGGPMKGADTDNVILKRTGEQKKVIKLEDLIVKGDELPLKEGDVIYVPEKEGWIDQPTSNTLTTIATLISTLGTIYLIIDSTK